MIWIIDDYLDIAKHDVHWFESNPDRALYRRMAFPLERAVLGDGKDGWTDIGEREWKELDTGKRVWTLVLWGEPFVRLYYPEDFYGYAEPATDDDISLMLMWDRMERKHGPAATLQLSKDYNLRLRPEHTDLNRLLWCKVAMIAYRKHQRGQIK